MISKASHIQQLHTAVAAPMCRSLPITREHSSGIARHIHFLSPQTGRESNCPIAFPEPRTWTHVPAPSSTNLDYLWSTPSILFTREIAAAAVTAGLLVWDANPAGKHLPHRYCCFVDYKSASAQSMLRISFKTLDIHSCCVLLFAAVVRVARTGPCMCRYIMLCPSPWVSMDDGRRHSRREKFKQEMQNYRRSFLRKELRTTT